MTPDRARLAALLVNAHREGVRADYDTPPLERYDAELMAEWLLAHGVALALPDGGGEPMTDQAPTGPNKGDIGAASANEPRSPVGQSLGARAEAPSGPPKEAIRAAVARAWDKSELGYVASQPEAQVFGAALEAELLALNGARPSGGPEPSEAGIEDLRDAEAFLAATRDGGPLANNWMVTRQHLVAMVRALRAVDGLRAPPPGAPSEDVRFVTRFEVIDHRNMQRAERRRNAIRGALALLGCGLEVLVVLGATAVLVAYACHKAFHG